MSNYVLLDATGMPVGYGLVSDPSQLANQAINGRTAHALPAEVGLINMSVRASTTITDVAGKTWEIDPPFQP